MDGDLEDQLRPAMTGHVSETTAPDTLAGDVRGDASGGYGAVGCLRLRCSP
jgi:hypothetical protein